MRFHKAFLCVAPSFPLVGGKSVCWRIWGHSGGEGVRGEIFSYLLKMLDLS